MKKTSLLICLLAAMFLVGCASQAPVVQKEEVKTTAPVKVKAKDLKGENI